MQNNMYCNLYCKCMLPVPQRLYLHGTAGSVDVQKKYKTFTHMRRKHSTAPPHSNKGSRFFDHGRVFYIVSDNLRNNKTSVHFGRFSLFPFTVHCKNFSQHMTEYLQINCHGLGISFCRISYSHKPRSVFFHAITILC